MKKAEKSKITREKIIVGAIKEFGTKDYNTASVNAICTDNAVSKGLIYHHFKSKDELYLECIRLCYEKMKENLKDINTLTGNFKNDVQAFLKNRELFFKTHPHFKHIFFYSILFPPDHLSERIKILKQDYDAELKAYYSVLLSEVELRETLDLKQAVDYLLIYQEMFNRYFTDMTSDNQDIDEVIQQHDKQMLEMIDVFLYGIAKNRR